jgi:hypothetical protein
MHIPVFIHDRASDITQESHRTLTDTEFGSVLTRRLDWDNPGNRHISPLDLHFLALLYII